MIAHYGRIHILVNLAGGLTRYTAAVDHTLDDWIVSHSVGITEMLKEGRERRELPPDTRSA